MSKYNLMKTLSLELMEKLGACQSSFPFVKNNNLEGFPLERLDEVKGDFKCYVGWLSRKLEETREYDEKGNCHLRNFNGSEVWRTYDDKGNCTYLKTSNGFEEWSEYDDKGNLVHFKNSFKTSKGFEEWFTYDEKGNLIHWKNSNGSEEHHTYSYYENGRLKAIEQNGIEILWIPEF